ncbi:hypothetical protein J1N35_033872 [Gossypium stocksii]|uniref:Uncharacterized protein n=1 Tax=Gossypium stocksii TaxID=47602 RepID=A0A9D3ZPW6_9ROSI|nr:hypothetical protein J1N35_033872 [Gossypium stocksii]
MLKSSIGRYSTISAIDFSYGVWLRLVGNPKVETSTRHSMIDFDFNFRTSMFYAGNTYICMPSSYTSGQFASNIGFNIRLTRMNNVLHTTYTSERTSNPGHETVVPTKLQGSGSDNKGLDNVGGTCPDFMAYEPPPHMLNVNLSAEDGLEFSILPFKRLSHASFSTNFNSLQVRMKFSSKDAIVVVVK